MITADMPSNKVGYVRVEPFNPLTMSTVMYFCTPRQMGVGLDVPLWKIMRVTNTAAPDGTIISYQMDYPDGSIGYEFAPNLAHTYNYLFTNT